MTSWSRLNDSEIMFESSSSSSCKGFSHGSVVWGNIQNYVKVIEDNRLVVSNEIDETNLRTFSDNWNYIDSRIDGSFLNETLELGQTGYAVSEVWKSGPGNFHVFHNKYDKKLKILDVFYIEYRTAASSNKIITLPWVYLKSPNIQSLGYIQLRVSILSYRTTSSSSSTTTY
jgi:hypothetical protein